MDLRLVRYLSTINDPFGVALHSGKMHPYYPRALVGPILQARLPPGAAPSHMTDWVVQRYILFIWGETIILVWTKD